MHDMVPACRLCCSRYGCWLTQLRDPQNKLPANVECKGMVPGCIWACQCRPQALSQSALPVVDPDDERTFHFRKPCDDDSLMPIKTGRGTEMQEQVCRTCVSTLARPTSAILAVPSRVSSTLCDLRSKSLRVHHPTRRELQQPLDHACTHPTSATLAALLAGRRCTKREAVRHV